jgi:hypothetical protein
MPKAKDLTGDLGRLRNTGALPTGAHAPVFRAQSMRMDRRTTAFNLPGWLIGTILFGFAIIQCAFLIWLI